MSLAAILLRRSLAALIALLCLIVTPTFAATYTDNGNGTVTDPGTGLIWMRCSMGQTWTGSTCTGTPSTYDWVQANALTGTVSFAGHSDWRLPNIRELRTLVDPLRYNPAIDTAAFPNTPSDYFWSASDNANVSYYYYAWGVHFWTGSDTHGLTKEATSSRVRLVRAGQSSGSLLNTARPTTDYVDHSNGTVTHTPTGLMWQRCAKEQTWTGSTCSGSATAHTWNAAMAVTDSFAGHTDWRLPTINELESLVDYTKFDSALNATIFPASPSWFFWSASADASDPYTAWYVYFGNGEALPGNKLYAGSEVKVLLVRAGQSSSSTTTTTSSTTTTTASTTSTTASSGTSFPGANVVAAGDGHACAVTSTSGVKCWGRNSWGELGDGTTTSRKTPGDVAGLTSGIAGIASGLYHACALTTAGGVKCWGNNQYGGVGDNSTTSRSTPVDVAGLTSGVKAITAAWWHTCALTTTGGVKCWGSNSEGQLGDGTTTNRATPVDVSGLTSGVVAIAAEGSHSCAITSAGGVKCWGRNGESQLGDNSYIARSTPVDVSGLASGIAAIELGSYHSCALTTAGGMKCWGANWNGQLGNGTTSSSAIPVDVTGLSSGVVAMALGSDALGSDHSCALTTAGGMKCWGYNVYGQLGDGSSTDRSTAVNVSGLTSGVVAIAAGNNNTCAVTNTPQILCWGRNDYGQLGDNTATDRNAPVVVQGLVPATGGSSVTAISLVTGWNLVGNGSDAPIDVVSTFSDTNSFLTIWKWIAAQAAWAFHAPSLAAQGGTVLSDYVVSKGYQALSSIAGGEGFWVNAKQAGNVNLSSSGKAVTVANLGPTLITGWNLSSIGETATAKQFCDAQSGGVTTLWAWDATNSAWYFYAPSLDTSGSLGSYVTGKGYLDFTTAGKTLGQGVGFWVNRQ